MAVIVIVRVLVSVVVVIVVRVRMPVVAEGERGLKPGGGERSSDRHHDETGHGTDPREESLGDDVGRGSEREKAERVDTEGVGCGDDEAQEDGVSRGAARADQVSAHHGLPVAGAERVQRAETRRHEQRGEDEPRAERGTRRDQLRHPVGEARRPGARR